ncbi:MAG: lytic murein transglycosylase B, partial [Gammaproteobacteria bacterium]
MRSRTLTTGFLTGLLALAGTAVLAGYGNEPQVQAFIAGMVDRHDFTRDELLEVLGQAERRDDIIELMSKPAEKRLAWHEY